MELRPSPCLAFAELAGIAKPDSGSSSPGIPDIFVRIQSEFGSGNCGLPPDFLEFPGITTNLHLSVEPSCGDILVWNERCVDLLEHFPGVSGAGSDCSGISITF